VLLVEGQAEQVVLGEQLAQVPRVLRLGVDLRGARRDALGDHLADRVAELDLVVGEGVGVGRRGRRGHVLSLEGVCAMTTTEMLPPMGIGTSLFLVAVGAILYFAVDADVSGLEISTIGIILMVVGVIGLLISLFMVSSARRAPAERTVVRDREPY